MSSELSQSSSATVLSNPTCRENSQSNATVEDPLLVENPFVVRNPDPRSSFSRGSFGSRSFSSLASLNFFKNDIFLMDKRKTYSKCHYYYTVFY